MSQQSEEGEDQQLSDRGMQAHRNPKAYVPSFACQRGMHPEAEYNRSAGGLVGAYADAHAQQQAMMVMMGQQQQAVMAEQQQHAMMAQQQQQQQQQAMMGQQQQQAMMAQQQQQQAMLAQQQQQAKMAQQQQQLAMEEEQEQRTMAGQNFGLAEPAPESQASHRNVLVTSMLPEKQGQRCPITEAEDSHERAKLTPVTTATSLKAHELAVMTPMTPYENSPGSSMNTPGSGHGDRPSLATMGNMRMSFKERREAAAAAPRDSATSIHTGTNRASERPSSLINRQMSMVRGLTSHLVPKRWSRARSVASTRLTALTVHLVSAVDLPIKDVWPGTCDPFVVITVTGCPRFKSKVIKRNQNPVWNEMFAMTLGGTPPHEVDVQMKVYDHDNYSKNDYIGELVIALSDLLDAEGEIEDNDKLIWYPLIDTKARKKSVVGQLQVGISVEHKHMRDLKLNVLAATWNMGNKGPPRDLTDWLRGCHDLDHELVAIGVQECSYEDKKEGGGPTSFPSSCAASMTMGRNPLLKSRVNSTRNELADSQPELCSTSSDFSIRWGSMRPETFEEDRTASPLFRVPSSNPPSSPSPPYACCESAGGRMQAREPQPDLTKTVSFSPCGTSSRGVTGSPSGQNHLLDSPNSSLKPTYSPVSKKPKGFHQVLQKIRHGAFVDRWENGLSEMLGGSYVPVKHVHMGQIRLSVYVRSDIFPFVKNVHEKHTATGVGGVGTNKGGVMVSLEVFETRFQFVNSHLAAHQGKVKERNRDYSSICQNIVGDRHRMELKGSAHHLFWMGDLNYRVDWGEQRGNAPTQQDFQDMMSRIQRKDFRMLGEMDQLQAEIRAGNAFPDFAEAHRDFPPTFKVLPQAGFAYTTKRLPAWTDRVLYYSPVAALRATSDGYFAAGEVSTSDHKPVAAAYKVPHAMLAAPHLRTKGGERDIVVFFSNLHVPGIKLNKDTVSAQQFYLALQSPHGEFKKVKSSHVKLAGKGLKWNAQMKVDLGNISFEACERMFAQVKLKAHKGAHSVRGHIAHGTLDFGLVVDAMNQGKTAVTFEISLENAGISAAMLMGEIVWKNTGSR